MAFDRPLLKQWMEKHRVALTPEAIGELLALTSPTPTARQKGLLAVDPLGDWLVTDTHALAFAGFVEGDPESVWYRKITASPWNGEFEALRALALDLLRARRLCDRSRPLSLVFHAARRYRTSWSLKDERDLNLAARELVDAVGLAEDLMTTDRDADGRAASA
jgi:hypothetical protein